MNAPASVVLCALLTLPTFALAQDAGPSEKPREVRRYEEVERGLYFGVYGGPTFLLNAPQTGGDGPFSNGLGATLEIGYDFGERVSVGLLLSGAFQRGSSNYFGTSTVGASGDFSYLAPGVNARVHIVGFADNQDVKRTWFYVRGGAAYAMFSPKTLIPDPDFLVFAGPGIEYHTRLRHFTVGLDVTGQYLVSASSFGFAVSPNLRYAF